MALRIKQFTAIGFALALIVLGSIYLWAKPSAAPAVKKYEKL